MKTFILSLALCGAVHAAAQTQEDPERGVLEIPAAYTYSPDSLAFYIDSHCRNEDDKLLATYQWITHNLSYNVFTTFESRNEAPDEEREIRRTLRTREGVCRQFALLFQRVANQMGIPAFIVHGYTKSNNVISPSPHSWCIAKVGNGWSCYDPTFDMGYISNERFVRRTGLRYYRMAPSAFIRNHIPFDPIWQALDVPSTYDAFDQGSEIVARPAINFNDSIRAYGSQTPLQQLSHCIRRMEQNGTPNRLVNYYLELSRANMKVHIHNHVVRTFYRSQKLQNDAEDRRHALALRIRSGFKNTTDDQIRQLLTECREMITQAQKELDDLGQVPEKFTASISNLREFITKTHQRFEELESISTQYLATQSNKRRSFIRQYMN